MLNIGDIVKVIDRPDNRKMYPSWYQKYDLHQIWSKYYAIVDIVPHTNLPYRLDLDILGGNKFEESELELVYTT